MVFLADWEGKEHRFAYGIFGVQHEQDLTEDKKSIIKVLQNLLSSSAGQVDLLLNENHGIVKKDEVKSTTFVAYWLDAKVYEEWIVSTPVKEFWDTLPEDAGVWREVMKVPTSRYMFAANQNLKWGLANLIDKLRASDDEGYWGVYRHRIGSKDDTFTSPYTTASKATKGQNQTSETPNEIPTVLEIPATGPTSSNGKRPGHVRLATLPNNLCFVREGQRQPHVAKRELDIWLEKISPHARSWIQHLDTQREKNGVLSFSTHIGGDTVFSSQHTDDDDNVTGAAETDQLAYFLDLARFERAGRSFKDHVHLRKQVMEIYGPGGVMEGIGKAELYVELVIVKSGEMDVEYVGCFEGTGLMFLEGLQSS